MWQMSNTIYNCSVHTPVVSIPPYKASMLSSQIQSQMLYLLLYYLISLFLTHYPDPKSKFDVLIIICHIPKAFTNLHILDYNNVSIQIKLTNECNASRFLKKSVDI